MTLALVRRYRASQPRPLRPASATPAGRRGVRGAHIQIGTKLGEHGARRDFSPKPSGKLNVNRTHDPMCGKTCDLPPGFGLSDAMAIGTVY